MEGFHPPSLPHSLRLSSVLLAVIQLDAQRRFSLREALPLIEKGYLWNIDISPGFAIKTQLVKKFV